MGSKNKLKRFAENETFSNVIQPDRAMLIQGQFQHKGRWGDFFQNNHPIVLELGCGKGEYSIALATRYPNKNFIGIDIKGARFWRGAKMAIQQGLVNVAFVRMQIELLDFVFAQAEVDEIWITFPDPQIKYKRTKHRLINPVFLEKYKKIIKPQGLLHLKTDSQYLHGYTLGLLQGLGHDIHDAQHDIYNNYYAVDYLTEIQTFYECQYLEQKKPITYIQFSLR